MSYLLIMKVNGHVMFGSSKILLMDGTWQRFPRRDSMGHYFGPGLRPVSLNEDHGLLSPDTEWSLCLHFKAKHYQAHTLRALKIHGCHSQHTDGEIERHLLFRERRLINNIVSAPNKRCRLSSVRSNSCEVFLPSAFEKKNQLFKCLQPISITMGLEGGSRFMKIVLILFNSIVLIVGCIAIGLGAWSLTSDYGAEEMSAITGSNLYEGACIVVIVGGCIVAAISLLGCCGAVAENRAVLAIYSGVLILLLVLFTAGAITGFFFIDD
ncbi:tetraspanin, partial [Plakobranchus ocellatus]